MRKVLCICILSMPILLFAQTNSGTNSNPQIKQFWFVLLKAGPHRDQDSATMAKIQSGHLANIGRLYEAGSLKVAGPFGDQSLAQGIFIFDVSTESEVKQLLETDPAVKAGRLIFDIHPWYTAPIGSFAPGKPLKN